MKRTPYRHLVGPVPAGSGVLYEVFHREIDGQAVSGRGLTVQAAWMALGVKAPHAASDWVASPRLVNALGLPPTRIGQPSNMQRKALLATAALLLEDDGISGIADPDSRAACLKAFARLMPMASAYPEDAAVLFDMRGVGSSIRRGVVGVRSRRGGLSLFLTADRESAQALVRKPARGAVPAVGISVDALSVAATSDWFAEAMMDAFDIPFSIRLQRRLSGRAEPMPAEDVALLAAIAQGLPDDPMTTREGTGAMASQAYQSVCMLSRTEVVPAP